MRGIVPRSIPVPITFEYRTTTFTSVGQDAARELLGALQEQKPSRILLIGHTDVRGTAEFNMKLSRDRADAVASFLQENGLTIPIETEGKAQTSLCIYPIRLDSVKKISTRSTGGSNGDANDSTDGRDAFKNLDLHFIVGGDCDNAGADNRGSGVKRDWVTAQSRMAARFAP